MYVGMWEYENLAEMERASDHIFADEGMKSIAEGFHRLVEPTSFSTAIWYPVAQTRYRMTWQSVFRPWVCPGPPPNPSGIHEDPSSVAGEEIVSLGRA
jgi:hypothetical protein